jgi:hypothetical protein
MKKLLYLLAFMPLGAWATTVTSTWTNPTQNTDDSAIPATGAGSLSQARVEYGTCNGTAFGTKAGEVMRPMPTTTATLNLNPGTTCVRVSVINTYGAESQPSNVVTRVIDPPVPKPPVLSTVTLAINIPLDSHDGFNRTLAMSVTSSGPGVPVGFVKLATPVVGDPVFTWRGQSWCRFLPAHPTTGASNIEWIKGVNQMTDAAVPCA